MTRELELLNVPGERKRVYWICWNRASRRSRGVRLLTWCTTYALAFLGMRALQPYSALTAGLVIPGLCALPWLAVYIFVFRPRIRTEVRRELNRMGVPVCVNCGYDLRGQVENRCPECGNVHEAVEENRNRSRGS